MNRVVCAGPTIHGIDRTEFDILNFHPPASRGDLLRLVSDGASAILLIDGLFGDRPSVSHKEILYVLSRGIPVFGAASLGALRAAECSTFGMQGIGAIFEDYESGARVSDADVAIIHAPVELQWQPVSTALVDIDATLDAISEVFSIDATTKLRSVAKHIHFAKRTWSEIVKQAGLADNLVAILADRTVHLKQQDALEALKFFVGELSAPPSFDFDTTETLAADIARYVPCRLT